MSLFVLFAATLLGCASLQDEDTAAAQPKPTATPTPVPRTAPARPRGYPAPKPEATPKPVTKATSDSQTVAAANQDADEAEENGKTVFEDPEADRSYPKRKSPEELGEARGEINVIDANDPLLETYQLHGVKWPMAANAGSSRVYEEQKGKASYYTKPQKTASGDWYDPSDLTAAHKSLPFGTLVKCTNSQNGKSVTVMINDRGPYVRGRIIDLSHQAAKEIGLHRVGVCRVTVEVIAYPLVETRGPKGNG